jgi:hypothetical protein
VYNILIMSHHTFSACAPVFLAPQFDNPAFTNSPELDAGELHVAQAVGRLVIDELMLAKEPLLATKDITELEEHFVGVRQLLPVHGEAIVDKFPTVLLMEPDNLVARVAYLDGMAQQAGFTFMAEDMLVLSRYALLDFPVERLDVHRAIFARFARRIAGNGKLNPRKIVSLIDVSPTDQIIFLGADHNLALNRKNVTKHVADMPTAARRDAAVRSLIKPEIVIRLGDDVIEAFEEYVDYRVQHPSSCNH